jgi:RNA polymerase sigma-70 factor (ECF subfamily)
LANYSSISDAELVRACAESNESAAWLEFVARFQRPIRLSIIRAANRWGQLPGKILEDLAQETYLRLCADGCRLLMQFAVQHPESVSGYIKVIAFNLVHDHFKASHSQKRGAGNVEESLTDLDPQSSGANFGGQSAMERHILMKQINACLEATTLTPDGERDRLIFWMYYRQGLTAKAIAALPTVGLTAKGVEAAIFRLTRKVREQIIYARTQSENSEPRPKGFCTSESY